MKKTQFTDAIRNIRKRWVSFLSVIVIALLGTSIFLSMGFASKAIALNGTQIYDAMRFRNAELISTLLVSEDDLAALRKLDGVACAEPVWQAGVRVYRNDLKENAYLITVTEQVNVPQVLEGRLPEAVDECAIERSFADRMQIRIGDRIDDIEMTDDAGQYVMQTEFTVTGIVMHPDHISSTLRETGYIIVRKDAFDLETLRGACMKAEILLADQSGGDRFSDAHGKAVSSLVAGIEALEPERAPLTTALVKQAAHDQIGAQERSWQEELERVLRETPDDTEAIKTCEQYLKNYAAYHNDIDNMAPCRWLVLGERGNAGFVQVSTCRDTLRTLRMNFGLMFIAISTLTILATVGKMVKEQRSMVGTAKALGFYNREILQKYLLFGVSAVCLGVVGGCLVGRFFMEAIELENYNNTFTVDLSAPLFDWGSALIVLLAGIVLAAGVVWIACRSLMKESANALMQSAVPRGRLKASKDKKHILGLYSRLILRNIRIDRNRVIITIVSVLGCCTMIGIGFTLKNAVMNAPRKESVEIIAYDVTLTCNDLSADDFQTILDEAGTESIRLYSTTALVQTDDMDIVKLMCGDIAGIGSMHRLLDWETGKPLDPTDDGVYLYQRLAEKAGLHEGSELKLTSGLNETATVKVAGVFKNYLSMPVVMSKAYYESLFAKKYAPNTFLIRLNGADPDALFSRVKDEYGFLSWTTSDGERAAFERSMGAIGSVDALLIAIAAIMAGVVQLNLTSTYILQKKRELTLMRINGFTVRECIGYLLRETVFTTVIGILSGVAAGTWIGYWIIRSVELPYAQFDRSVCVPAWIYAAGITVLFTVVIHAIALRKVGKLKLTDIA